MTRCLPWRPGPGLLLLAVVGLVQAVSAASPHGPQDAASADLDRLLTGYRHGDPEAALAELVAWPDARLEQAIDGRPDRAPDPWDAAALALLHTEAAFRRDAGKGRDLHLTEARRLMTREACGTARAGDDEALRRFCRDWYVQVVDRRDVLHPDDRFSPGDPRTRLALGAAAEREMGPVHEDYLSVEYTHDADLTGTSHGRFNGDANRAIGMYKDALEGDPDLIAARVRLGHVLYLLDRSGEARTELERALAQARRSGATDQAYLSALMLGRLHEEAGQAEAALAAYESAAEFGPRYPAATLAAARLRAVAGDAAAGAARAVALLDGAGDDGFGDVDPWTLYREGSWGADRPAAFRALRQAVRR